MERSKKESPHHLITAALAASPLFAALPSREASLLTAFCRYNVYKKGNIVFVEGDYAGSFYVVAAGQVKVFKGTVDGRDVILKIMRKGDLVGEAASLGGKRFPASAQAITDAATVEIPRADFIELIKKEPRLALNMIAALSERLHQISAILEKLTMKEVPSRLAAYLLQNARPGLGGGKVVELQIKKVDLAAELGTVPETLSRALKKFADAGFVDLADKRIILVDEDALAQLAEGVAP